LSVKRREQFPVTEFKARCLELLAEVGSHERSELIVTKHGKPLARVVPATEKTREFIGFYRGSIRVNGDLTAPSDAEWDAAAEDA
jgi:prevent-host-death family protein